MLRISPRTEKQRKSHCLFVVADFQYAVSPYPTIHTLRCLVVFYISYFIVQSPWFQEGIHFLFYFTIYCSECLLLLSDTPPKKLNRIHTYTITHLHKASKHRTPPPTHTHTRTCDRGHRVPDGEGGMTVLFRGQGGRRQRILRRPSVTYDARGPSACGERGSPLRWPR